MKVASAFVPLLDDALVEIDAAEDEESHCAADGDWFKMSVLLSLQLVCSMGFINSPILMLTLPANARPPTTASPVQHACPTIAPSVTNQ